MSQDVQSTTTADVITRFNDAFNRHDVSAIMDLMTQDCVFENTYPPPDGMRYEGQAAVRAFWEEFFHSSPHAAFQSEDMITCGDRCVVRWLYTWIDDKGQSGQVRGVDIFRVRDGKVAEKFSYVKG
jgi:ketosteroid isomerase-like protein